MISWPHYSSGEQSARRAIDEIPMAEDFDMAVDLNDPYMLKPLFLTELAFVPDDDDESDEDDPQQPYPRSGHRIVCIGNHSLYAFGGYNPEMRNGQSTLFCELWRFDLTNYRWTQVLGPNDPGMPQELASMSMVASGQYILVRVTLCNTMGPC